MFDIFLRKLKLTFTDPEIRKRIFVVIAALAFFRFLAAIPIPGVNHARLAEFFANNQFMGLLNIFSGGGLAHLSVMMLGVAPYINASIIMQVATIVFPKVKEAYFEEGEAGRTKFIQWSRILTIPLAIAQGIGFLILLQNQGILPHLGLLQFSANVALVAGGSFLLTWVGELITEFGIGNGVSLIIFAGIVASLPSSVSHALYVATSSDIPSYLGFLAISLGVIYAVVVVSDAERSLPIAYARAQRGDAMQQGAATYLPIRILQAGVIPIIFALSLLLLPQMALSMLSAVGVAGVASVSAWYASFVANPWQYGALYFLLVIVFTYFYTAITFDPKRISEDLQKSGAFIPGVRPGNETEKYVNAVVNRVTLPGAVFLGLIAVAPFIIQGLTGITTFLIGGTALLIVVQVVLELVLKIDAQISLREY
ncbi:MAG TPA: preprotein translocase subunit SecY [Candidatus Kaiserbacteria bacterium]|nr:preprotein translocase subunit SecY [Candidatus Kaiserbacteria bacterium]